MKLTKSVFWPNQFASLFFAGFLFCIQFEPSNAEDYTNLEIREASQLEVQFPDLANTELSIPSNTTEADAFLSQTFQPVIDHISEMPSDLIEEAAAAFQRARVRLTNDTRPKDEEFRLANDMRKNLAEYKFRPITIYGRLQSLSPLTSSNDDDEPTLKLGEMNFVGTDEQRIRFLVQNVPTDFPTGDELNHPVSLTGFFVPVNVGDDQTAPQSSVEGIVIAPWLEAHHAALDPQLFAEVRDRTVGIEPAERSPMMKTLAHTRLIDYADQKQLATKVWEEMQSEIQKEQTEDSEPANRQRSDILFVDLFKNPDLYRGKPVTLSGTLRSLAKWPNSNVNGFEIDSVYEARIFPEDGQSNPVIVNFLEKPTQIPISDDLNEPVQFTGYFFKMYGYADQADVLRVAPLFLARKIEPVPVVSAGSADEWILIVGGGILLLIIGFVCYARFNDRRFQKEWQEKHTDPAPDLTQLE
ncbi:hypothetical protein [Thalassoroseus pseudoceratinae]|uniref:hypothetical protein n=1 Tax=Thalassoroseus pseudoceratinae TaxID=2713176 RepID=UPI00141E0C13|nr:hypothetical protein [Thalassoroseus pseudoceratinae]